MRLWGGRLIQDNLIIAHEAFHALKRKEKGGKDFMAIKLDMNRAYDRLEWSFLEKILLAYGFAPRWVSRVLKLVSSVSYSYKVNGHISSSITPQRGLRQGDPISPYLFILVVDALSHLINKVVLDGRLQGFQLARGAPTLTHLFFADDALLFSRASPHNAYELIRILNVYSKCSGQRINLSKSGLICGKFVRADCKQQLSGILGMNVWENPGKYLGLPAEWGRNRTSSLAWIKERVVCKLQGWKESLLNQAGKEVLIKAVIQAIPSYAMSMIKFPKTFCHSLCAMVARFWWSSHGKERGIHWKKWSALSVSKKEGGLGFKDFNHLNSSLLAKQAWRIIRNPEALWVQILKAIYFPNVCFLQVKRQRNESCTWTSLLHGREVIKKTARWTIGNGEFVDIREDCWLASGEMALLDPIHQVHKVKDLMDASGCGWNRALIRNIFSPQMAIKVVQTPIQWTAGQDCLRWPAAKDGEYSVKSGYKEVWSSNQELSSAPSGSNGIDNELWNEI